MQEPLVSIVVPCFKKAQYLSEALDSIQGQTYQNWECIIVNDGSPDCSHGLYKQVEKDSRIHLFYNRE